jgi:hypothetical protein
MLRLMVLDTMQRTGVVLGEERQMGTSICRIENKSHLDSTYYGEYRRYVRRVKPLVAVV